MKIISLFSGAGGLDLGLVQAGHSIVWANDNDENAVKTYRHNIGNHIVCSDVQDIDIKNIPTGDVVVGGFPCQGFSVANMKRHVSDERNLLYKYFLQIVKEKQPPFFIAENVKGILSLGAGVVINSILSDFGSIGYMTSVNCVNMADYGVPQKRQRVFILGQRKGISDHMIICMPQKTHSKDGKKNNLKPWVSIKQAIGKYGEPTENNRFKNHICSSYKVVVKNFTAHRQTDPNQPSPTILARGNGRGGVCAIPHYNGRRRLSIRESAAIQTFPDSFEFFGGLGACYRQVGNAVPVLFGRLLGDELKRLENEGSFTF